MADSWTLQELVAECAARIAALPVPANGQVRAVPDERMIRYYATLGLLDRPAAMRGRTALYNARHLAQVVAIKRLQTTGRSLAEIQKLWSSMDDVTLTRMSGVNVIGVAETEATVRASKQEFWKREPVEASPAVAPMPGPVSLTLEIAPDLSITIPMPGVALSHADVAAIRAAAAPLVAELAKRQQRGPV